MSVVVSHPTGSPFVRAVLRAAEGNGRLHGFWTAVALPPSLLEVEWVGNQLRRELCRRTFAEVSWRRTHARPTLELVRVLARRLKIAGLTRHERGWASVDAVYHRLDHQVAAYLSRSTEVRAVYAYEDGALASFRAARERGVTRLYDLPIAYWRTLHRLLTEEAELHPEWAATMEGLADSPPKLARKDEELRLADRVVVASSFTRRSLEEHFGDALAVTVTPYGAPPPLVDAPAVRRRNEPLHLLYAGHLAQRKGVAYLVAALARLDVPWRLTLAGPKPAAAPAALEALLADPRCDWLGAVPHATLLEAMTRAHVFVFPSIVEGFGMVLYEAMAAGLPVITTPNTAGPDILTEGVDGFVVPIRDPDAIAERIAALAADEDRRQAMATAALATATASGWRAYEDRIAALLDEAVG